MSVAQSYNEPILRRMGLPAGKSALDGRGVAVGIADWGFDLLHPCLLDGGGNTRFWSLWDQNRSNAPLTGAEIDRHIATARRSGSRAVVDGVLDPHANYCWQEIPKEGAHGTLMSSIAAGTAYGGFRGVAPETQLIGVQLAMRDEHWKEVDRQGQPTWRDWSPAQEPVWCGWRSYDEQPQLIAAIQHLHAQAKASGAAGLVVNLSLGAAAGAHDGGSPVERSISEMIQLGECKGGMPTVVVLAAGNAGIDEGHFAGEARPDAPAEFVWRMATADPTPNKLEVWYRGARPVRCALELGERAASARGAVLAAYDIACGPTVPIVLGGRLAGIADHAFAVRNGLSRVRIILHPPYFPPAMPRDAGSDVVFTVRLSPASAEAVPVNAWLERDDGLRERSSLSPCHPAGTLGSIAMAQGALAVAGFDHREGPTETALFALSSVGPAPWPHLSDSGAPHIAAPGLGIWGARSKTEGFARTSGTSAAAALVSGAVALLMQDAVRSARVIRASEIQDRLLALAVPVERGGGRGWGPRYGWGAVNIQSLFGEAQS